MCWDLSQPDSKPSVLPSPPVTQETSAVPANPKQSRTTHRKKEQAPSSSPCFSLSFLSTSTVCIHLSKLAETAIPLKEQLFRQDDPPGPLRGRICVADTCGGPCHSPGPTWLLAAAVWFYPWDGAPPQAHTVRLSISVPGFAPDVRPSVLGREQPPRPPLAPWGQEPVDKRPEPSSPRQTVPGGPSGTELPLRHRRHALRFTFPAPLPTPLISSQTQVLPIRLFSGSAAGDPRLSLPPALGRKPVDSRGSQVQDQAQSTAELGCRAGPPLGPHASRPGCPRSLSSPGPLPPQAPARATRPPGSHPSFAWSTLTRSFGRPFGEGLPTPLGYCGYHDGS